MGALPLIAMLLAGSPQVSPAEAPTHVARLDEARAPASTAARCPDLTTPLDADTALRCAPQRARFAQETWRTTGLRPFAGGVVSVVTAYQDPQRMGLPPERTLSPYAGLQLRWDFQRNR